MLDVEAFILVGGASSRMGRDKSQLIINGKTTTEIVAAALEPISCRVRTVGSQVETARENIADQYDRWGPLGGIQAALQACGTERCIVVACDLPFVTRALLELLMTDQGDAAAAVVPLQSDGRPQPLCAVYSCRPCLLAAEAAIAQGEHSPRAMLDRVGVRYVDFEVLAALPGSKDFFINLNYPEDYELAKQISAGRQ